MKVLINKPEFDEKFKLARKSFYGERLSNKSVFCESKNNIFTFFFYPLIKLYRIPKLYRKPEIIPTYYIHVLLLYSK